MFKIQFDVVLDKGECKLSDAFLRNQKIVLVAEVIAFSNPENTCNYIMGAKFNRDLLKMSNFGTKIATPPTFFVARGVKLGSYVHCLSKCVV